MCQSNWKYILKKILKYLGIAQTDIWCQSQGLPYFHSNTFPGAFRRTRKCHFTSKQIHCQCDQYYIHSVMYALFKTNLPGLKEFSFSTQASLRQRYRLTYRDHFYGQAKKTELKWDLSPQPLDYHIWHTANEVISGLAVSQVLIDQYLWSGCIRLKLDFDKSNFNLFVFFYFLNFAQNC